MPRGRSEDYEAKTQAIMDGAAALFAKEGYPSAKMELIAKSCGATKSMLYHYFPTKDDLLYAMLHQHLEEVVAHVNAAVQSDATPAEKLNAVIAVYTQQSTQARRRHLVAMQDVKYLPAVRQAPLLAMQRQVTEQIAELLQELNPQLPEALFKPYTMMLVGILNWTDTWYSHSGLIKSQELCERISDLFLNGFTARQR